MLRGPWLMNFIYKKMKNVYTKTSIKFSRSKTSIFLCVENCNFLYKRNCISIACQPKFFHRATKKTTRKNPHNKRKITLI